MTLDLFSGEAYLAKTIVEKLRFFRSDEYYLQFYDDVSNAARCLDWSHQYCRRYNIDMKELIVQIYENAIAYAQYVCNDDFPDIALNSVINEIANLHYRDVDDLSSLIAPHFIYLEKKKPYGGVSSVTEEVGVVIESMCAVLCFDYMKQKDDRVIDALYNMRQWVYHRSERGFPVYPHWHFWNLLAERIPDNRYPSEGELRQRIKKLEEGKKQLEQEVLKLKNIAADETEEERDDEEVAEGRFPHRITVGYLLSLMGIKSKENIKNQAALKRALQGLTGVSPTSVNNYLEGFNLALRNNQSELDRLNKELRDAGLPEFHIELDSE